MRNLPLIAVGLVGLLDGGAIGVAAFGGDDTKTVTGPAQVVTNTETKTVGRKGSSRSRTRTVTRTKTVTVRTDSSRPGDSTGGTNGGPVRRVRGEQTFRGKGFKQLGTLNIAKKSVIEWTNSGRVFSVISQTALHVSSTKKKGTTRLFAGTYPEFRVAAIGNWTLRIKPR